MNHETSIESQSQKPSFESAARPANEQSYRSNCPSETEIDFAELEDGTLIELVEHPENSAQTQLAVWKDGHVLLTDHYQYEDRLFVPIRRDRHIVKNMLLARGTSDFHTSAFPEVFELIAKCVDLTWEDAFLLTSFILSTWLPEQLPIAPYVAAVGLAATGKSTLLAVMRLLCRRAILTSDISLGAAYSASEQFSMTLLLDDADSANHQKALHHFLKSGTTRDVVAFRKHNSFSAFGLKGIALKDLPDDPALIRRCAVISLKPTFRTDLLRPSHPEVLRAADYLRRKLLQYRFQNYKKLSAPVSLAEEFLELRTRDLYEALGMVTADKPQMSEILASILVRREELADPQLSPIQTVLLRILFREIHSKVSDRPYLVGTLAEQVNADLASSGEPCRATARGIGAALRTMGFTSRNRANTGWKVWLNKLERTELHRLVETRAFDAEMQLEVEARMNYCEDCNQIVGRGARKHAWKKSVAETMSQKPFSDLGGVNVVNIPTTVQQKGNSIAPETQRDKIAKRTRV